MTNQWYYLADGQQQGPVSTEHLRALAAAGRLDPATGLVWRSGMQSWQPAASVAALFDGVNPQTVVTPPQPDAARGRLQDASAPTPSQLGRVAVMLYGSSLALAVMGVPLMSAFASWFPFLPGDAMMVFVAVVAAALFVAAVTSALLWVRLAWTALPQSLQPTRAAMAIGLLFVPIFNFYWVFRVLPHISRSYEELLVAAGVPSARNSWSYVAAVVACVSWVLPIVNPYLTHLFFFVWLHLADRQRNALIGALSKA